MKSGKKVAIILLIPYLIFTALVIIKFDTKDICKIVPLVSIEGEDNTTTATTDAAPIEPPAERSLGRGLAEKQAIAIGVRKKIAGGIAAREAADGAEAGGDGATEGGGETEAGEAANCPITMHGKVSTLGTFVVGLAIIMYRLMNGTRTVKVKYVHLVLHLVGFALFGFGILQMKEATYPDSYKPTSHFLGSYVVMGVFSLQFLIGVCIFSYMYQNPKLRFTVAPFHDILGVWIFLCLVGSCISGKAICDPSGADIIFHVGLYANTIIVLVILLSPYFEWEVVGHL